MNADLSHRKKGNQVKSIGNGKKLLLSVYMTCELSIIN